MGAHDTNISNALRAHGAWKLRLKTGITMGSLDLPAAEISKDNICEFGQWLSVAKSDPTIANLPEFAKVVDLHRQFHLQAGRVAGHIEAGDAEGADAELNSGGFDGLSQQLSAALMALKKAS